MHVFLANVLGSVCKTCALMVSVIESGVSGIEICCSLPLSLFSLFLFSGGGSGV
jgi:hypothetical protein